MSVELCFAICTHRRNALLARALESLIVAERPDDLAFEVVVVDNSEAGEATPIVAAAAEYAQGLQRPFVIRGLSAHPANISAARNAALASSTAPWFAFLDDDQQVAQDWFVEARRAVRATSADILFGAIAPRFEAPALATASVKQLFTRDLDAAEGLALFAFGPDKTRALALTPGNALFRRQTTLATARFDPAYGQAGGEDFDLFCRLQKDGRRFVWRPSLRASEFVPASRCDPAYLRRRFYAGGQVYAAAVAGLSPRPGLARWALRAKALAQGLALAPRAAFAVLRGRVARDECSYLLAGVVGKLSLGTPHALYAEPEPVKNAASSFTKI